MRVEPASLRSTERKHAITFSVRGRMASSAVAPMLMLASCGQTGHLAEETYKGQTEPAQPFAHRALMHFNLVAAFRLEAKIAAPPTHNAQRTTHNAMGLRVGAVDHKGS